MAKNTTPKPDHRGQNKGTPYTQPQFIDPKELPTKPSKYMQRQNTKEAEANQVESNPEKRWDD